MITWPNFLAQFFNGLALGALLALISSGLTIIYGTLGVLNLAHGAMFMLGGYAGYAVYSATDSFVLAVVGGAAALAAGRRASWSAASSAASTAARPRTRSWSRSASASCWSSWCGSASAACRCKCRRPPGPAGSPGSASCSIRPTASSVLAIAGGGAGRRSMSLLYRTRLGMIVRAGIEDSGHGRYARHQRLSRVHAGVRHRRDGGGVRRHHQRADRVADPRHGRHDPGRRPSSWS